MSLLPLAPPRDEYGRMDGVAALVDCTALTDDEHAEQLTVERLAAAAGLLEP